MADPLWKRRELAMDQVNKIRGMLGDYSTPAHLIKRPKGMKKYLFEGRIAKLKERERRAVELHTQELIRYMKKDGKRHGTKKTGRKRRSSDDR